MKKRFKTALKTYFLSTSFRGLEAVPSDFVRRFYVLMYFIVQRDDPLGGKLRFQRDYLLLLLLLLLLLVKTTVDDWK